MQLALFWVFAVLMLLFGAGVVALRNPVSSALSLVMSFVALAALFITLEAFFIGVVQVLVYAGAVMVLFLFIIMLLDLRSEKTRRVNIGAWAGGGLVICAFVGILGKILSSQPFFDAQKPPLGQVPPQLGNFSDIMAVGATLFRDYNLPFQIIGILLLVATVGVVLLSKKELK
jgi:NADH-quinone oxidoreductase subunit J